MHVTEKKKRVKDAKNHCRSCAKLINKLSDSLDACWKVKIEVDRLTISNQP